MKNYIKPSIFAIEMDMDTDMLTGSESQASPKNIESGSLNNFITTDDDLSKRIDFSDDESIW